MASEQKVQRYLLAAAAAGTLLAGLLLSSPLVIADQGSRTFLSGTFFKVGLVLGVLWLAAPQLDKMGWDKLRGSALAAVCVVILLWAIRPKIGAIAGAALVIASLVFSLSGWLRRLGRPS